MMRVRTTVLESLALITPSNLTRLKARNMMDGNRIAFLGALVLCGLPMVGGADTEADQDITARCKALEGADFSGVRDAPAQVIVTTSVQPSADSGGYCEVGGYVTPSIGFLLRMPADHWNGKFVEIGCGGSCGTTSWIRQCPMNRGYACIVSDGGHKTGGNDVKWAYNNPQAAIDYVARTPHVTALAGKAIVERYYSKAPNKSYFMGCSAGGLQAFWEAQKFPWDFDGIVAGSPSDRVTDIVLRNLWSGRAFRGPKGESLLGPADLKLLHDAVVAKCDLNDGIKDGLIGDPRACHFDPAELRCTSDKASHCLKEPQIEAVEKIYRGPVTSTGYQISSPSAMKGSELNWFANYSPDSPRFYNFMADWLRYYYLQPNPGPAWKPDNFNFDEDYKRLGMGELIEPINPDLRRFKAAGSKLLVYGGWNDDHAGAPDPADYYESAEKIIGQRAATQDFLRVFMIPGMNHCTGGAGAYAIDYLTYLENWVERKQPPDKLIGFHMKSDADDPGFWGLKFPLDPARVAFSRPVYPYPTQTKYLGHGDPNDAASFGPADPPRKRE